MEEPPEDWDTEEDGEWKGEFNSAADRYPNGGCGPLTPALDSALVQSESVYFTASAEVSVDIADMFVLAALGYGLEAEALAKYIYDGQETREDTAATQPDDWDEDEDGPWSAPMLEGKALGSNRRPWLTSAADCCRCCCSLAASCCRCTGGGWLGRRCSLLRPLRAAPNSCRLTAPTLGLSLQARTR